MKDHALFSAAPLALATLAFGSPRGARHVQVTRSELADFVLGKGAPAKGGEPLAELDRLLDRSRLIPPAMAVPAVLDAKGRLKYNSGLEH
jgi:hypothetical protein